MFHTSPVKKVAHAFPLRDTYQKQRPKNVAPRAAPSNVTAAHLAAHETHKKVRSLLSAAVRSYAVIANKTMAVMLFVSPQLD
jgi:hypothetical protein